MEGLPRQEDGTRFIGTIERFEEGWRASFRLLCPFCAQRGFAAAARSQTAAVSLPLWTTSWPTEWLSYRGDRRGVGVGFRARAEVGEKNKPEL